MRFLLAVLLCICTFAYGQITNTATVTIATGSFTMGSTEGLINEEPVRSVRLDSFLITTMEITEELWDSVMSDSALSEAADSIPIAGISWTEAAQFCNNLSILCLLDTCYNVTSWACDTSKNGWRLPSEAEWEYACRSGTVARWYSGVHEKRRDDINAISWNRANANWELHEVAKKDSSRWGLHDMLGNASEWTGDWYATYATPDTVNPFGPSSGSFRVVRGGSFADGGYSYCRAAARQSYKPTVKPGMVGFRVVRRP